MLRDKYIQAKDDGLLTKVDQNMPLVILNPDLNGNTALDIALEK